MPKRFAFAALGFLVPMVAGTFLAYLPHEGRTLSPQVAVVTFGGGVVEDAVCVNGESCEIPWHSEDCSTHSSDECQDTCANESSWYEHCDRNTGMWQYCSKEPDAEGKTCTECDEPGLCMECKKCVCVGNTCLVGSVVTQIGHSCFTCSSN